MKHIFYLFLITITIIACNSDDAITENIDISDDNLTNSKPNILLIIADDMGVDATPGYSIGNTKPTMPTLQNMITSGLRFNNVWSNPTCTPTRATLLTGKYGFRTNVTKVDDVLSTSETSLQSYLKSNGALDYSSAVIGKWHLGRNENHPNNLGIEYFSGFLGAGVQSYWNWNLTINGQTTASTEYTTTKLTDLAIDWIGTQTQPWFLWLAYNAPHTPFHLPPNELHSQGFLPTDNASISANLLPYYLAMIEAMDAEMGRLINAMSQEEKDNTVIIFIGDNGTPGQVIQEQSKFRAKGSIYQGGVNVPMIISGKNVTRINDTEDALINTTDLFATIASIAGINVNEVNDSKNFQNLFTVQNAGERNYTYAENRQNSGNFDTTIRNTTHKYMLFDDGSEEFYELNNGELESTNLLDASQLPLSNLNETIKKELIDRITEIKQ